MKKRWLAGLMTHQYKKLTVTIIMWLQFNVIPRTNDMERSSTMVLSWQCQEPHYDTLELLELCACALRCACTIIAVNSLLPIIVCCTDRVVPCGGYKHDAAVPLERLSSSNSWEHWQRPHIETVDTLRRISFPPDWVTDIIVLSRTIKRPRVTFWDNCSYGTRN